jgi:hypothetical protein
LGFFVFGGKEFTQRTRRKSTEGTELGVQREREGNPKKAA